MKQYQYAQTKSQPLKYFEVSKSEKGFISQKFSQNAVNIEFI